MSYTSVLVVGAGASGLGCATELASEVQVQLFDRIPVSGGRFGWQNPEMAQLERLARRAGVTLHLGVAICRWDGERALLVSPTAIESRQFDHLFFTGGLRPGTAAELGVYGERPAGVLPASAALHLLETGEQLWRNPIVYGSGLWAELVVSRLRASSFAVTTIPASDAIMSGLSVAVSGPLEVVGHDHIRAVRLRSDSGVVEMECDALILAGEGRPIRNVHGAIDGRARNVTYVQPVVPRSIAERYGASRAAAREWLRIQRGRQ